MSASGTVRVRRRRIDRVDLARYQPPALARNRSLAWRIAWYLTSALVFQSAIVLPSGCKARLLRLFGARVGKGLVLRPRVTIKYPWFLELGEHVWLGEAVWIDNHTELRIGSHVCVSQGAYLFTGNHDYDDERFSFFCRPVVIEDGVWVGARAVVCPGSLLGRMSVLGAGVVWRGVAAPQTIHAPGNETAPRLWAVPDQSDAGRGRYAG